MRVIRVKAGEYAEAVDINSGLEALQAEVEGFIEAVYPFDDPVAIVCNEEGKFNGSKLNRALTDEDGNVYDIIAGTFLVVGLGDEEFTSVPDELLDKYLDKYKLPERFTFDNGGVVVWKQKA